MNYLFYDKNLIYPENKNEYSPSEMYPEYPFKNISLGTESNSVYTTIRKMFYLMGRQVAKEPGVCTVCSEL